MNIYAHSRDAFDQAAVELGELYAIPASISVYNAQLLADAQRVAAQLQAALTNRAVIDQALGIIMSRSGDSPDQAFDQLRSASRVDGGTVTDAAQRIVDDAIRQAQRRHTD
jgi:AmiR/NasT family two-component response regulator